MNCAYHIHNPAVVNCNGCGKPLCPACDHRIKGFPYCQDCIVMGVDLLRQQNKSDYAPFVKKRTSPIIATILSMICPGLGAAYNGQTTKALVYFAVFVGLFQMAILTGFAIFVFGFLGMWFFSALDAWRTAQMIRSGVTPDTAEDILVRRFSGNPKLWGIILGVLGIAFLFQRVFDLGFIIRAALPIILIGLGFYLLRGYIFRPKSAVDSYMRRDVSPTFVSAMIENRFQRGDYGQSEGFSDRSRSGAWRDR
jgi:hypothetical protein